jgi:hypothetical protein
MNLDFAMVAPCRFFARAVFGGAGMRQEIPTRHHKLESSQCRGGDLCEELRIMPSLPNDDTDVYIVIEDFGHLGRSFRETDLAEADLGTSSTT